VILLWARYKRPVVHLGNEYPAWRAQCQSGRLPNPQLTQSALASLLLQPATAAQLAEARQVTLTGDESVLATYGTLIDTFDTDFPIVSP
jgi:alkyl sulfatase BDS1-like metallo-beta-lactamase superfamily hydrolase